MKTNWSLHYVCIPHQDANAIRRAYARGEHWNDRVKLPQWWADYLDALRATAGKKRGVQ